jgi:hypothetical protein
MVLSFIIRFLLLSKFFELSPSFFEKSLKKLESFQLKNHFLLNQTFGTPACQKKYNKQKINSLFALKQKISLFIQKIIIILF